MVLLSVVRSSYSHCLPASSYSILFLIATQVIINCFPYSQLVGPVYKDAWCDGHSSRQLG